MILSIVFFLVTSAFTLAPDMTDTPIETPIEVVSGCDTCTFGSNGTPSGCRTASYCGLTSCTGSCNLQGELCGECAPQSTLFDLN